jgi:O-antigen/teichoic acid export membrane protein
MPVHRGEVARRVGVSVGVQMAAKGGHVVLNIVSSLAIIHYLRPGSFGDYVLIMALSTTVGMLADFGINQLAVREVSVEESTEGAIVGTVIVVRIGLSVVAALAIQAVLLGLGKSGEVRLAAALIATSFLSNAVMACTIAFHVRLRQHREALIILLGELIETTGILVLIVHKAPLSGLTAATAVGSGVAAVVAVVSTRRVGLRPRFEATRVRSLMGPALPLAIAGLVGIILVRLDSLMLAVMRSSRDVGIYGAAFQPVQYILIAVVAFTTVFLPLLSRFARTDRARFTATYQRGTEGLLAFMVPVGLVVVFLARPAVALVYPASYAPAVGPMQLLGVSTVLMALSAWQSLVLLSVGRQGLTARYNLAALGIGAACHAALIARYGTIGAALGTLVVGGVTAGTATVLVHRVAHVSLDVRRLALVAAANAIGTALGFGAWASGAGAWLGVAVGLSGYAAALWLLGVVDLHHVAEHLRDRTEAAAEAEVAT